MRFSFTALAPLLFAVSACTPACAPPKAEEPGAAAGAPAAGANGGAADPAGKAAPPPESMIMEAKGVDTSKLSEAQRASFFQVINTEPSACDKPHSMATSIRDDASCRDSLIVAQFVADALGAGASPSDLKRDLEFITDSLKPKEIDISGRPLYGNPNAPVTLVVFADFECPHCAAEFPELRKAVDRFAGRVKLVYRHFPLSAHPRAKVAAVAAEAAHEQGKFWEMAGLIFSHQTQLEDANLQAYAQQAGLDQAAFQASFGAKKGQPLVEADRAAGEKLEIQGTPAVFVNGRQFNEALFGGSLDGWIDDALKR